MTNFSAEYIKGIMEDNYRDSDLENEMTISEYVSVSLEQIPESFDCFFDESWDEISEEEQRNRVIFITGIFN